VSSATATYIALYLEISHKQVLLKYLSYYYLMQHRQCSYLW